MGCELYYTAGRRVSQTLNNVSLSSFDKTCQLERIQIEQSMTCPFGFALLDMMSCIA